MLALDQDTPGFHKNSMDQCAIRWRINGSRPNKSRHQINGTLKISETKSHLIPLAIKHGLLENGKFPIYAWCSQLETSIHSGFSIIDTPSQRDLHVRSYSDWEFRPLLCGAPWSSKCVPAKNEHQTNSPSSVQNPKCSPFKNCLVHRYPWISPKLNVILRNIWDSITTCNHQSTGFWTLLMAIIAGKKPKARWSTLI